MFISVVGLLGYETAALLYSENEVKIKDRFPGYFVRQFEGLKEQLAAKEDVLKAGEENGCKIRFISEIGEGGLFAALWEAGEALKCGMEADLLSIPVKQEVTEIMELFAESPYESSSKGCFLVVSEKELPEITCDLRKEGNTLKAAVIGKTDSKKARVLKTLEGTRFMTPPERQKKDIKDRRSY